jgi:hypothetical protein
MRKPTQLINQVGTTEGCIVSVIPKYWNRHRPRGCDRLVADSRSQVCLSDRPLRENQKERNYQQQARCGQHGRGKCIPRARRWGVNGAIPSAHIPFIADSSQSNSWFTNAFGPLTLPSRIPIPGQSALSRDWPRALLPTKSSMIGRSR